MGAATTSRPVERWADRIRLPLDFDPARLGSDLDRLRGVDWIPHFVRQNYRGDWSVIPLRGPAGAGHPLLMITAHPGVTDFEDSPALAQAPYFREVLAAFGCPLQSVRLMRLAAGACIHEHRDPDLDADSGIARLHVPIVTNAEVAFLVNGSPVAMAVGETWYLRLADPHSVANRGGTDRVHLVIDAVVDDWLKDRLDAGAA